ncbi:lipopolysaccharide biosynthesis protein [Pseudomonas sp. MAC6]|uniref:lipopolysaccharide biosynthesis protein n=1 Tax=Pseudomonas sp. MAC6 TaxID=3401633 RepID=UPI003BF50A32
MAISWFQRMIGQGGFVRSVLVLVSGAAFAHVITALALPILTRLYTPADFSLLAVFSSLLSIFAVVACLRFDIAIPMPGRDAQAFNLLALAMGCAVLVSLVAGVLLLLEPSWLPEIIGRLDLQPYLWLLPVGIFLAGAYSALQNWFVREKAFSLIAQSRVAQSAASAGTQVGMAGFGFGPIGLLFGYLLNTGAAFLILGVRLLRHEHFRQNAKELSYSTLKLAWRDYSRFPKYSTWEALANSAAIQLPVIMVAALAAGPEAGYLLLAMTVIQAPMSLFGSAIGQVYLSRAPEEYREGRLGDFTADILGGLVKAGVGPLLAIGILSPLLFEAVFGEGWGRAGWLVAWMTPWFVMQFIATPVSMVIHVTGHQKAAFALQLFGLILRVSSVLLAVQFANTPLSEAYALSGALFYSIYLWLALRCAQCSWVVIRGRVVSGLGVTGAWIGIALLLAIAWALIFAG